MKNWLGIALMCGFLIVSYPSQLSAEQIAPKQSSPEEIGNLKTFKDWCVNQEKLPPETKRTIEELLRQAETKDCDRTSKKLASITSLSLNRMLY
ncbi:MAG: hypothetical protein HC770_02460 [Pseudanabaena sp. CRU_2_10]|nr:hypothetical protein [Pseudanabaena sp. CRU_2_10]